MARIAVRHVERTIEDAQGRRQRVTVHLGESPLCWLHARGLLDERLYRAGEKLRADWERAGLGPRVTMRWDAAPPGGGQRGAAPVFDLSDGQRAAKARFDGAMETAGGGLADILWRVACAGEGLAAAERALGWPTRAGKLVLTLALDRVAGFYRL